VAERESVRAAAFKENAYTLTWPLMEHLSDRPDLQARLREMNEATARLLPVSDATHRAVAAANWPALVAAAESVRKDLARLADFRRARQQFESTVQADPLWDEPTVTDRLRRIELHRWLGRASVYPLPYPDWLAGEPLLSGGAGNALTAASDHLRRRARLGARWQYGMEVFVLFGTADGFWESLALGPFWRIIPPGKTISPRYATAVAAMPGFRPTDVQDVNDEKVFRHIQSAIFLLSGLAEPNWEHHPFRILDLIRSVRLLQLRQQQIEQFGVRRSDWATPQLQQRHIARIVRQFDDELAAAETAGHLTAEQRQGLSRLDEEQGRTGERELHATLKFWRDLLPEHLDDFDV